MSYDLWLEADLGAGLIGIGRLEWNYTSNCAPMWRRAMPETDGLAGMDGMTAHAAGAVLRLGLERMGKDPEAYRALNPENGWGEFESTRKALVKLLEAFDSAPQAVVKVSR